MGNSLKTYQRREGSIWIDKNNPHNLKYYAYGKEYTLAPSAAYDFDTEGPEGSVVLGAGTVVRFDGANGIKRAVFPDDIDRVLGVVETDVLKRQSESATVAILQNGYSILETPSKSFATPEDLQLATTELLADPDKNAEALKSTNYYTAETIIGAPVYWFIGRIKQTAADKFDYTSPQSYAGKITLAKPSGFPGNIKKHDSLNISYDNLPQIGSVSKVTVVQNKITKMTIHLNFSKFDSSLEWSWPGEHSTSAASSCGKVTCYDTGTGNITPKAIVMRHGLFTTSNAKCKCFADVIASPEASQSVSENDEFTIRAAIQNNYNVEESSTASNKYNSTTVMVSTPETMYYRVSGRVNYKFDKNHK